jgi:hypothetical protein
VVTAPSVVVNRLGGRRAAAAATPFLPVVQPAVQPIVEPTPPVHTTVARANTEYDTEDSNDDDERSENENINNYVYNDIHVAPSSDVAVFLERVGCTFTEVDDGVDMKILSVCAGRKVGDKRTGESGLQYFYKYCTIGESIEFFTPCREVLNSTWAHWHPRQGRAERLHNRMNRTRSSVDPSSSEDDAPVYAPQNQFVNRVRARDAKYDLSYQIFIINITNIYFC